MKSTKWRVVVNDGGLPFEELKSEEKARKLFRGVKLSLKKETLLQYWYRDEWATMEHYKPGLLGYLSVNKGWLFIVWGISIPFLLLCTMLVGMK